ncbi:MAG TPA: hypothetical protein VIY71_01855 [Solirubrobacterales bacterium]
MQRAIAQTPEGKYSNYGYECANGYADIRVMNGLLHLLSICRQFTSWDNSADQIDQRKDRSNAPANVATDERVPFEVRPRRFLNQPPDSCRDPTEHHAGADRRCLGLDYGCQGADLGELHAQTLTRPGSRVARQMRRAFNATGSNQRRDT